MRNFLRPQRLPQEGICGAAHLDGRLFSLGSANVVNHQSSVLSHENFAVTHPADQIGMPEYSQGSSLDSNMHNLDGGKLGNRFADSRQLFGIVFSYDEVCTKE